MVDMICRGYTTPSAGARLMGEIAKTGYKEVS